jgi:hypothetical protein
MNKALYEYIYKTTTGTPNSQIEIPKIFSSSLYSVLTFQSIPAINYGFYSGSRTDNDGEVNTSRAEVEANIALRDLCKTDYTVSNENSKRDDGSVRVIDGEGNKREGR